MKPSGKLLAAILALVLGALALTGCGGLGQNNGLLLANIGWDENVAVSNLTKVLLEDELGYETVEIRTQDNLNVTYRDVASGEVDAFQDVWLPNQQALLDQVAEEVEHLDPWFLGKTKQGMAVPAYMDVKSIDELNGTDAKFILGIEPSSVMLQEVGQEVIPAYGLQQELVTAPTAGMLAEVEQPICLQGRVRVPRLVAALDESEVRHHVSGGSQGRHVSDERPGRNLDHRARGPAGEGPRGLRVRGCAGADRGADQ